NAPGAAGLAATIAAPASLQSGAGAVNTPARRFRQHTVTGVGPMGPSGCRQRAPSERSMLEDWRQLDAFEWSGNHTLCSISEVPHKPATLLERKSGAKRMRKIGYARVSTSSQNLDRQIGALRAERCHEVHRETASGRATKGRPQLEKAIDALGKGDVLVVAEWDRATRSMIDGVHIIERI